MASLLRRLSSSLFPSLHNQHQQARGLRVKVRNGNVEQALSIMERRMKQSGMERLIKKRENLGFFHMKNSEKKVLARKNLKMRIRSEELAKKLRTIIVSKIRGM